MSCCGGNCGCGADCKCGPGCTGCKKYPDFKEESFATSQTTVLGVTPQKSSFEAAGFASTGSENGACNCKAGGHCSCNPCNCK